MKFIGYYKNGFVGCDEKVYLIADSLSDAEAYISFGYFDFMASYDYLPMEEWYASLDTEGISEEEINIDEFYESDIYLDYIENGSYCVHKLTEDELKEVEKDDSVYWIDIR